MTAKRYGALPVVRATGGLKETVIDLDEDPVNGNGFLFNKADDDDLWDAVKRSARFFSKGHIPAVQSRVMSEDHSSLRSAERYADLYREAIELKSKTKQTFLT
jgi:starch synthase